MELRDLETKKEEILRIAQKHGAYNIRIFGSVARGEAHEDSDVDFIIDAGPDTSPWFPGGLLVELEKLLGRKVHILTEDSIHWYLREKVLREAVPL